MSTVNTIGTQTLTEKLMAEQAQNTAKTAGANTLSILITAKAETTQA